MARHPLEYRKPTDAETEAMKALNTSLVEAFNSILRYCPKSADRTLALRHIQYARAMANMSIINVDADPVG